MPIVDCPCASILADDSQPACHDSVSRWRVTGSPDACWWRRSRDAIVAADVITRTRGESPHLYSWEESQPGLSRLQTEPDWLDW